MPGHQVFAGMVLRQLYLSADRVPVYMHIGRAHEDGHLQALVLEIFRLKGFFYYHYLAIAGRNDQGLILVHFPERNTEEGNNEKEQDHGHDQKAPAKSR